MTALVGAADIESSAERAVVAEGGGAKRQTGGRVASAHHHVPLLRCDLAVGHHGRGGSGYPSGCSCLSVSRLQGDLGGWWRDAGGTLELSIIRYSYLTLFYPQVRDSCGLSGLVDVSCAELLSYTVIITLDCFGGGWCAGGPYQYIAL